MDIWVVVVHLNWFDVWPSLLLREQVREETGRGRAHLGGRSCHPGFSSSKYCGWAMPGHRALPPKLGMPGPSWEHSEQTLGLTGAVGQRVLGRQESEKVNTVCSELVAPGTTDCQDRSSNFIEISYNINLKGYRFCVRIYFSEMVNFTNTVFQWSSFWNLVYRTFDGILSLLSGTFLGV